MTNGAKNHPQTTKIAHKTTKNRPDIINPVCLCGVVDEAELKALLKSKKQNAWCTRVRILGLLLLIDYICRNLKKRHHLNFCRSRASVRLEAQKEGLRDHDY